MQGRKIAKKRNLIHMHNLPKNNICGKFIKLKYGSKEHGKYNLRFLHVTDVVLLPTINEFLPPFRSMEDEK